MSSILRQATNVARNASRTRTFTSSAVTRKDLVQDLYLQHIKGYKPATIAKDHHVGSVKQFSLPPTPKAPALPTDLAGELATYDAAEPTLAEAPASTAIATAEDATGGAEAFLSFLEQDVPKPEHHH
ncbi:unnamed protein product [Cyclocybe aegerita]|uniref:Uncharacterized protein n=1 Tax=Cyclocybe aegerita TaxID=1973307 RepID=A0A8S0XHH5_CYCAE|nr:unnamed protein product [Cyclocybe aegerita]